MKLLVNIGLFILGDLIIRFFTNCLNTIQYCCIMNIETGQCFVRNYLPTITIKSDSKIMFLTIAFPGINEIFRHDNDSLSGVLAGHTFMQS